MADQDQSDTAVEESPYTIKVEDAGPATKKITVEIPRERIDAKLAEQFKELKQEATVPGFRKGHAPAKLIEKKFGTDIKNEVRRALVSESYQEALEKNDLHILGEPDFENPDKIELPESGPLTYSFSVEIQPEITLPDLKGIKVKKPKVEVTDEHINQAMMNLREQQGTIVPVEDRGVQAKDIVESDIHIHQHNNLLAHHHDVQFTVRDNARLAGYPVPELVKEMEGAKLDETRKMTVTAPKDHPAESVRGQEIEIEVKVKNIRKLEAAEVNQEFLDNLGFAKEEELRDALKEQMLERVENDVQRSMRQQVINYLLDKVDVTIPSKLSKRQAERVVSRRAVQLMMRGVAREQIQANIERLQSGAEEEAARELKSFFILQKVAQDQKTDVSEGELNQRIAIMAIQQGQRPEKLKQTMGKDGSLANLFVQMREEKAVDEVLKSAEIEEVEAPVNPDEVSKAEGHEEDSESSST